MKRLSRLSTALLGAIWCALLSTATSQSQCIKPPAGLVLWYPFDEKSVTPGARDLVSNAVSPLVANSSGPIASAAFVPGHNPARDGGAFFFDEKWITSPTPGTIGYLLARNSSPTDFGTDKSFSIDFWVFDIRCGGGHPIAYPCPHFWMSTGTELGPVQKGWSVATTWTQPGSQQSILSFRYVRPQSPSTVTVDLGSILPDTWTHIAITVDRKGPITSYINGAIAVTVNAPTDQINLTSNLPVLIGGQYDHRADIGPTPRGATRGYLDELEIYHRVLTGADIRDIYTKGKCKSQPPVAKGMTWRWGGVNATSGTVIVGCGASDPVHPCNGYVGDQSCADSLPLLCFKRNPILPRPKSVVETPYYYQWSGGIVATSPPVAPAMPPINSSLANADKRCVDEFGKDWRVAEFHDGGRGVRTAGGWNFHAYGNVGDSKTRFWVHIDDQKNGTCFTKK